MIWRDSLFVAVAVTVASPSLLVAVVVSPQQLRPLSFLQPKLDTSEPGADLGNLWGSKGSA